MVDLDLFFHDSKVMDHHVLCAIEIERFTDDLNHIDKLHSV